MVLSINIEAIKRPCTRASCFWAGSGTRLYALPLIVFSVCFLLSIETMAQLVQVPISQGKKFPETKKNNLSSRTQALVPMKLPFWDDFSFTKEDGYPNDTLWSSGNAVWVNNGIAVNPPSIFTATFDGLDATGKPYNLTDVLAKGSADSLVSRPIQLDLVPSDQLESVYLSFFFQVAGKGEAPDKDDTFSLWFRGVNGTWEKVFEVSNSSALDPGVFEYRNVKVDPKFFHGEFQFKFQNFARLSGPYDVWNLDYVYLNKRRTANDIYFHDQALAKPLTSIFKKYTSIPMEHYRDTAVHVTISPKTAFFSLYVLPFQPFKYTSSATVITRKNKVPSPPQTIIIEADKDPGILIPHFQHLDFELVKTIPVEQLDLTADSIYIDFKLAFLSGDTNTVAETPFYFPVDFTRNDTIHSEFLLDKHYAYDDGSAEYGAGLNRPGGLLAYRFDMFTKEPDTLVAVDIYFPEFGDNAARTVILKIWNTTNSGQPGAILHRQTITVKRTQNNVFSRYELNEPIGVKGKFFIGWEQTADVVVPVGLDQNTESTGEIYFDVSNTWEQNQTVIGSLMIHPVFGKGPASDTTGLTEERKRGIYPNPNQGEFHLPLSAENISVVTMQGLAREFTTEQTTNSKLVIVKDQSPGLLIVRWQDSGNSYYAKVLIRN
jgi:hypothetical protein